MGSEEKRFCYNGALFAGVEENQWKPQKGGPAETPNKDRDLEPCLVSKRRGSDTYLKGNV